MTNDSKTQAVLVDLEEVVRHYHGEFCEYDGMDDGVPVCAGECREFAEALTPVSGRGVEWTVQS